MFAVLISTTPEYHKLFSSIKPASCLSFLEESPGTEGLYDTRNFVKIQISRPLRIL